MFLQALFPLFIVLMVSFTQFARDGYTPNADFNRCYAWLQNQTNASLQILSVNHTLYGDPSRRFFTLLGCRQLCGTGYQPWPIKDIVDRFSLWLFPGFILLTHFNFAPLGVMNYLAVICHAAGDPIDSLWSVLTRFEVNRRLLRTAEMVFKRKEEEREVVHAGRFLSRLWTRIRDRFRTRRSTSFEHIATIWAAYEELGWQDATSRFLERTQSLDINESQWKLIRQASYDLSSRRQASLVLTFVPILSLAGALGVAVVKTIQQIEQSNTRLITETAHTIAVVCLLFIFIPLVAFSGSIGTVSTVTAAVDTVNKLRHDLMAERDTDISTLFPGLTVPACLECSRNSDIPATDYLKISVNDWPRTASYMGMNSIWRPCKHIQSGPQNEELDTLSTVPFWRKPLKADFWKYLKRGKRGKRALRFCSLFFVIAGASVPAMFLSITNHVDEGSVGGVGCRALSWLTIMCCWLLSFADDWYLRRSFHHKGAFLVRWVYKNPERLWRHTIGKDIFCVAILAVLIALEQIGVYNSCWCRASFKPYINLQPYNDWEWYRAKVLWASIAPSFFLFNLVIIAWLMFVGGRATSVLCKSQDKLQADLEEIHECRRVGVVGALRGQQP
jgi:hypothetical protein